ncbi:MAG TPA: hypothetical protein VM937_07140 [Burkholderiaceae bacterium]|nr:hypothetical protein [Burkholderiaceae bacterium]
MNGAAMDAIEAQACRRAPADHGIRYPSYRSFDEFIDVERLKSLDGYVTERIEQRLAQQRDIPFYTGPYRLNQSEPERPGIRMIYLAQSTRDDEYFDLDKTELWHRTEEASEFQLLMDFIATLPFKATGRMLIMYDDAGTAGPAHRDHIETGLCHEFIWFRTNFRKPFYMLDPSTGERQYVDSYSAWFDTVNQFHGTDAHQGLGFSIRVDGIFTDQFRQRIPWHAGNRAATPALWASMSGMVANAQGEHGHQ